MTDWIRQTWALGSVKLAAIAALLATVLASNQTIALGLIYFLPDGPLRIVVALVIGVIVFAVPVITQLVGQPKKANGDE